MFALEPGELGKVTLQKHEGKPDAPYCLVRAMSVRQQREYAAEYDKKMQEVTTTASYFDTLSELFLKHVESFHGYKSEELEEAFTEEGLKEILRRMLAGKLVQYEEKKS